MLGGLAELTGTKLPGLTKPGRQDRGAWRAKTVRLRWNHGPFGGSKALSRTGGGSTLLPEVPRQVWLALGALGRGGDLLPLRPCSQPGSVVLDCDAQRGLAEEQAQRRVVAVHERQDSVTGGPRVAGAVKRCARAFAAASRIWS